jgi:hypothetical protein
VLADIERGDLTATPMEVHAIRGAVLALDAVADAPAAQTRRRESSVSRRVERGTAPSQSDDLMDTAPIDLVAEAESETVTPDSTPSTAERRGA